MFCQIYCARAFKQLNTCTASCEIVAFTTYSVSLYSLTSPLTLFGPGLDRVKARYTVQNVKVVHCLQLVLKRFKAPKANLRSSTDIYHKGKSLEIFSLLYHAEAHFDTVGCMVDPGGENNLIIIYG